MQRYNGQLINQFANVINGNAAAGALVTVKLKSTGATVTLYAEDNLSGATLANPLTADAKGYYGFYAPDGVYTLDVSISGTPQLEIQLQDVAALQAQFDSALSNAGYIPVGTFAAGCTVSQSNGVVSDGSSFWRWDGALPKTVTAGSAPTPTGAGNWILISDEALRGDLAAVGSTVLVGGLEAGKIANRVKSVVTLWDFGATGGADDTAALKAAASYIASNPQYALMINDEHNINTFADSLDIGTSAACKLAADINIIGVGKLASSTTTVSNSIFGIDSTSGAIRFKMSGVRFGGTSRYRALSASGTIKSLDVSGVDTDRQSIISVAEITEYLRLCNNYCGKTITSSTAVSPTITINRIGGNIDAKLTFEVIGNTVVTGTEVSASGAFVIHEVPIGGTVDRNTHINAGMVATEGFDIDNVGKFARIINNTSWGSSFEYKTGTGGFSDSRDIIFSNNISYNSVLPSFSLRSSCLGSNNIAYNPAQYGLFISSNSDVDGLLQLANTQVKGFKIVWAGSVWTRAVKVDNGIGSLDIDGLEVDIDPAYAIANPTTKMPNILVDMDGNITNLSIRNALFGKAAADQINFRPSTTATKVLFENIRFGDTDDSCLDLANCTNVVIQNPSFPTTIGDRPVRLSTCSAVRIYCDYHASITLAATSGSNTGVLINNLGYEAAGAATAPSADGKWPVGATVQNTTDNSVWLRVSASATPATAWKQIA